MRKITLLLLLFCSVISYAQVTITHSASQTVDAAITVACPTEPTNYQRTFDLANQFAIMDDFEITEVQFGVEVSEVSGTVPIRLAIIDNIDPSEDLDADGVPDFSVVSELFAGDAPVTVADELTVVSFVLPAPVVVPAGQILLFEIPEAVDGTIFRIGSNIGGETAPSYLFSTTCGFGSVDSFGFDNDYVMNLIGDAAVPPAMPFTECGPVPVDILDNDVVVSAATVTDSGIIGTDFAVDNVDIDITHTFDGDLTISLTSPAGTELILTDGIGGAGDNYTDTVFQDGGADISGDAPPFTGTFEPQGGTFADTFLGEEIAGDWTLNVADSAGGDQGTIDFYCITFAPIFSITCQDITVSLDEMGNASIVPDDVLAGSVAGATLDISDFTCADLGENTVTVTAMQDGETATCTAIVTVVDDLPPVVVCPDDMMVQTGDASVPLPDFTVDATATDNCTDPLVITQDPAAGTAVDVGTSVTVTLTSTDGAGNDGTCTFEYTVTADDNSTSCGPVPVDILDNDTVTSAATVADTGIIGTDFTIDNVEIDITHTFDGDLDISLVSPTGTSLALSLGNGGGDDNYTDTVFQDGGADITAGAAPFTGTFQPQGGTFADTFAGEEINGDWTLSVADTAGGDQGTIDFYCITFAPVITDFTECGPTGQIIDGPDNNDPVNSAASITESGILGTDLIIDNVEIDISHTFDGDLEVTLISPAGTSLALTTGNGGAGVDYTGTVFQDGGDDITAGAPPFTGVFQPQGGTFADTFMGEEVNGDWTLNIVDTVTSGEAGTLNFYCITFATINDITCQDITVSLDEMGNASIVADDVLEVNVAGATVDISDFTCADLGENTVTVTAEVNGETLTCEAIVTVVDDLPPVLICPEDLMVETGEASVPLPDFTIDSLTIATDNCSVDLVITQDPAPGTAVDVGTSVTVTMASTDASGNEGTCTFTYTVTNEDNFTECGPVPVDILDNDTVTSTATVTDTGIIGDNVFIDNVDIDITHTFDGDLDISLVSPAGTTLALSTGNGGADDNYTDTVFQDGGADITAAAGPFTGVFQPQGGTFADTFAGEEINGDWTLSVADTAGGDQGTIDFYCITFTPILSVGDNAFDGFNFFPNPAQNTLNINAQTEVQNITLVNLVGQVVLEQQIDATSSQIDISRLTSGVYLMQVSADGQIGTYKVIKE